ncbi:MAG: metallophosphoesterase [Anaerolineales bacterium]
MKILAVSDTVSGQLTASVIPERFRNVDLVLCCGDLPLDYMEHLVDCIGKGTLFYVNGNHVQKGVLQADGSQKLDAEGCIDIHRRIVNYKGLLIGGLEGSMAYNRGPHQYSEFHMSLVALSLVPKLLLNRLRYGRSVDIMISHAPPRGIHDQPDRCHTGFGVFLRLMRRYRPRYWLHGHVHLYRQDAVRTTRYLDTTVTNVYGFQLIEIDDALLTSSRRQRRASPVK